MRSNALAAPSFDTGNLPACRVVNDNRPMPRLRLVSGGQETCLENFLPLPHARARALTPQPQSAPRKITVTYGRLASGQSVYGYVGGNPVTRTDPRGLDWNVTEYQGGPGNPFGHVGMGGVIPNMSTPTIGFYGSPSSSPIQLFEGSPSVWMTDTGTPITTVTIQTSPWQDFLIENYLQNAISNPQEYSHSNTCSSAVGNALNAGGVNAPSTIFPGLLIPGLRQMQPFSPIPASSPAFTPAPQY